jgi:hypothetical protein
VRPLLFSTTQREYSPTIFSSFYLKRKVDNKFETTQNGNVDNNFETEVVYVINEYFKNIVIVKMKIKFNLDGCGKI